MPSELFPLAQGYNCEFVQKHNINDISSVKHFICLIIVLKISFFAKKTDVPNQHFLKRWAKLFLLLQKPLRANFYHINKDSLNHKP